jgi:SDR family mycofactocin-dependent oxidoreductase
MTGRVADKVALITGAARGQGRSHALRLAEEGADIIAVDRCRDYDIADYPMATEADLAETAALVKATGRRIVTARVDVRDAAELKTAIDNGVGQLGRLDIVSANAGVCVIQSWDEVTTQTWQDTIDTNLTGVWNTITGAVPHLIAAGGGSIVCTSSNAGFKGLPFLAPYSAAKHGLVGLTKTMANELAPHKIRLNLVVPTAVATPMVTQTTRLADLLEKHPDQIAVFQNALGVELLDPVDISHAVVYLASDESRYVTGMELTVDAGSLIR